jgi:hypothetical protein
MREIDREWIMLNWNIASHDQKQAAAKASRILLRSMTTSSERLWSGTSAGLVILLKSEGKFTERSDILERGIDNCLMLLGIVARWDEKFPEFHDDWLALEARIQALKDKISREG